LTPSEERDVELKALRDRSLVIVRFIQGLSSRSEMFSQIEAAIDTAYKRGDLRGLRLVLKDVLEWVNGLPTSDREQLDEVLRRQFGSGLTEAGQETHRQLLDILSRGTIQSVEEYRLLSSRADEIRENGSNDKELQKINLLLMAFHHDNRSGAS
jgi:hypothetical protein